jgi:hypothetical protein
MLLRRNEEQERQIVNEGDEIWRKHIIVIPSSVNEDALSSGVPGKPGVGLLG